MACEKSRRHLRLVHDGRRPQIKYISCVQEICYKEDKNKRIGVLILSNWFTTHVMDGVLHGDCAMAFRDPRLSELLW